jgi:hypothetical protein
VAAKTLRAPQASAGVSAAGEAEDISASGLKPVFGRRWDQGDVALSVRALYKVRMMIATMKIIAAARSNPPMIFLFKVPLR